MRTAAEHPVRWPAPFSRSSRWALGALGIVAVVLALNPSRGVDLRVYILAANRFWTHIPLYQDADGPMPFKYSPAAAWLFSPMLFVPPRLALPLWNIASVLCLGRTARALGAFAPGAFKAQGPAFALALLALAGPFYCEINYGQVDLLMLALLVGSTVLAARPTVAGLCLAVAIVLKPPALLFVLLLLIERRWRTLLATTAWQLLLWAPVLLLDGLHGTLVEMRAWGALVARTTTPWAMGHNPQGWPTLLLSVVLPPETAPSDHALLLAQTIAMALFFAVMAIARPAPPLRLAAACLGTSLLSPLCWRANLVMALPLVWAALSRPSRASVVLVLALTATGLLVNDFVLSAETFRQVMYLRPFALTLGALAGWVLVSQRLRPEPSEGSVSAAERAAPSAVQPREAGPPAS
jgi:hypothetical protein